MDSPVVGRAIDRIPPLGPRARRRPMAALLGTLLVVALVAGCDLGVGVTPGPSTSSGSILLPTPSPSPTPIAASPSFVRPTPTPEPTALAYVVAPGDTLTAIARRFGTTARSIALWNRGTYPSLDPQSADYSPDSIQAGWTLSIIPGIAIDIQDVPAPSPTAPVASIPAGPTPLATGSSLLVSYGPRNSNAVALTFDMGGRLDPALAIVDWLVAHDVRATIFPTGAAGTGTGVGREVLARIAAHPDLFAIGNHSWDHPDFRTLAPAAMAAQLTRTEAAVEALVGRSTKPFFRPPYGSQSQAVRDAVGSAGWAYTIMWDVDTIDWRAPSDGGPSASDIAAKVLSRARAGSIVLMHLGGWHTLEALPAIVDGLHARGLEPVTLTELLGVH